MKAYSMMELDCDEAHVMIPFMFIAETASRAIWETGKRKRMYREAFTESERELCNSLIATAKKWALKTGVPETVTMRTTTYAMWNKLADFCASL